jgi:DNA-directed RNA polymerase subunit omega
MARVTVEDCILKIPNRFDLVVLASNRTRQISAGAPITLERSKDKNPVIALREIAESTIDLNQLYDVVVQTYRKVNEIEEPQEEPTDLLEQELAASAMRPMEKLEDLDDSEELEEDLEDLNDDELFEEVTDK